jgi:BlaI family transcriptional regulator, penicillinase repressor
MKTNGHGAASPITDAEMVLLKALWAGGPATVRECASRVDGRDWAYTTVQTLLTRMESKGLVSCDRSGQAHVFSAAVSQDGLLRGRLREVADQFCGGLSTPLVLALIDDPNLSQDDIAALRAQLDRLNQATGTENTSK